jgi:cytochrome c biogenesis protein CcmG/thiol:disulfide interchange protein DsbE
MRDEVDPTAGAPRPRRLPSRRWLILAAGLPIVLLILWAALFLARTAPVTGALIGNRAPELDLADLDGATVRLADLRGHPVLVNFWASWCGPCIEEFPLLTQAAEAHAADGLVVVGVVYQDSAEGARDFMERMGATWATVMDPGGTAAARYGIIGPPDTFFIDPEGIIAGRQIGQLSANDLERQLGLIIAEE